MTDLVLPAAHLPAMNELDIAKVRALIDDEHMLPQVPLETRHVLHAGLYSRTVRMPAGVRMAGALIKIPMLVIVHGDALVWIGAERQRLTGHAELPASANRQQVFISITETFITMVFPTDATSVEEAERQFTDDHELLASRRAETRNDIVITGE